MMTNNPDPKLASRRWFMQQCGVGMGGLAFHSLLGRDLAAATDLSPEALAKGER